MSKKLKVQILQFKSALVLSLLLNAFFLVALGVYFFTPSIDEWVIQHSLERFCEEQKEDFDGAQYSPAYLCTFLPTPE